MKAKTKATETETVAANRMPAYVKRIGSLRASVWEMKSDSRTYWNISLVRRFKQGGEGNSEWKDTSTLNGSGDAVAAIEALRCCVDFINKREEQLNSESFED